VVAAAQGTYTQLIVEFTNDGISKTKGVSFQSNFYVRNSWIVSDASRKRNKKSERSAHKVTDRWAWLRSVLIAVAFALCIRWSVAEPFKIPSGSMEPTLHGDPAFLMGDRIFVNKHAYGIRYPFNGIQFPGTSKPFWYADSPLLDGDDPERWDIVVFRSVEPKPLHNTLVKRIVALPGERVLIQDGKIEIDGVPLDLPEGMTEVYYTRPLSSNGFGLVTGNKFSIVPEGHYFMLGDNSQYSQDGRWFGFVPKHHIMGEVTSIWWPVPRWDDFSGYTSSWWWIGFWGLVGAYVVMRLGIGRFWKADSNLPDALIRKGEHVFIRYSLGIPIPFFQKRITSGRDLRRGETVLFRTRFEDRGEWRGVLGVVVGLPGERVMLDNEGVLVDNVRQSELTVGWDMKKDNPNDKFGRSKGKEYSLIPDGRVFIVNPESGPTEDSRCLGWIPLENVLGSVSMVWWPPHRARTLN
jgi:signal peptidase I